MRCEHEHDDGAYVLGALSPKERAAYERHLATCSFCREAVRDIAALPDMLSRIDAKEFAKIVDSPGPAPVHGAKRRNRAALPARILSSMAAAVLVALIGLGVFFWTRDSAGTTATPPGPAVAMSAVGKSSMVTATVRLTSTGGGTRVDLDCSYSSSATRPYTFRLMAYGPDADEEQIGSWQAAPGAHFTMEAVTHFTQGSLSRLELVQYDGKALLAYDVP